MEEKEKMKIGIDIDEVISEFVRPYLEFHNKKFGTNFKFEEISEHIFWNNLGYNTEEMQKSFDDFQDNYFSPEDFPLLDGSKDALNNLSKIYELFIISSRPKKLFERTRNFFKKHFPDKNFKILFSGEVHGSNNLNNKEDLCLEYDVKILIEDSAEIGLRAAKKGIKVFLLDKPWNKNYEKHENIVKVKSWKEILEGLKK